jgi:hypothetical protein
LSWKEVSLLFIIFSLENRIGGQNIGNVISQILLCKQINPDFQLEELGSITKDSKEIAKILSEMQEFMPKQEAYLGKTLSSFEFISFTPPFAFFDFFAFAFCNPR